MTAQGFLLSATVGDEDVTRLRMGRLFGHEEQEGRRLVEGQGGAQYLRKLLGLGVEWSRPSIKTSRPTSPEGRQSFVFRHATVSNRYASGKSNKTEPGPARTGLGVAKRFSAYMRRESPSRNTTPSRS